MIDLPNQTEIFLRDAGYSTWVSPLGTRSVTCFENEIALGFAHFFAGADELLRTWRDAQLAALTRFSGALKSAGPKAWNVYSLFLAADEDISKARSIDRIEEDFTLTRKIAHGTVRTADELQRVLMPLTAVRSHPVLLQSDFETRLRAQLRSVSAPVLSAFTSENSAEDVARILGDEP